MVDLLQRPAPAHARRAAAEHEHRRGVLLRRGDRTDAVGHSGARGERRNPRFARHLRPALCGERSGGLVPHVDDVDPLGATAVVDREQVSAQKREQLAHAVGLQAAGHQAATVERRRLLRLNGHGAAIYPPGGGLDPDRAVRSRSQRGYGVHINGESLSQIRDADLELLLAESDREQPFLVAPRRPERPGTARGARRADPRRARGPPPALSEAARSRRSAARWRVRRRPDPRPRTAKRLTRSAGRRSAPAASRRARRPR